MAKIDVTKIEGFDAMSAEDKVNALLGYEIEEPKKDDAEINRYKQLISKANAEAADYRKQLREKQTEAERAEADRLEQDRKLREEIAGYKERERFATYKSKSMSAGADEKTAEIIARCLPDGVKDEYFDALKSMIDEQKQNAQAAALNRQPSLSVGTPPTAAQAERDEENVLRKHMGLPLR